MSDNALPEMLIERRRKLIEALRSGKYKQTGGVLNLEQKNGTCRSGSGLTFKQIAKHLEQRINDSWIA